MTGDQWGQNKRGGEGGVEGKTNDTGRVGEESGVNDAMVGMRLKDEHGRHGRQEKHLMKAAWVGRAGHARHLGNTGRTQGRHGQAWATAVELDKCKKKRVGYQAEGTGESRVG